MCFFQIKKGFADPFLGAQLPRLEYVLRGIKKNEAKRGSGSRERLPITPVILKRLKEVWSPSGAERDTKLIWAACCLCFFAFLRAGELTVPSDSAYDSSVHLSVGDIAVDDSRRPSFLRITIKQSKTDPFRKGVDLFVGRTGSDLCPVAAVLDFLQVRGMSPGPLFLFEDGRPLTRQRFVVLVRDALRKARIDQSKYCGHSFRIGAATTAAAKGMEDCIIKILGRWESLAYLQYVYVYLGNNWQAIPRCWHHKRSGGSSGSGPLVVRIYICVCVAMVFLVYLLFATGASKIMLVSVFVFLLGRCRSVGSWGV